MEGEREGRRWRERGKGKREGIRGKEEIEGVREEMMAGGARRGGAMASFMYIMRH